VTTVAVIDHGMGNLRSVTRALESLHAVVSVTGKARDLEAAERIVLPGVGAFGEGMRNLRQLGLIECLDEQVRGRGKPFLGICLGMELLAVEGHEHGHHAGLGWIDATAVALTPGAGMKTTHIGWNDVRPVAPSPLFSALGPSPNFYFVHQYHLVCRDRSVVTAVTEYGGEVVAAVERGNVAGVQFHPEKSQETGLALLRHFLRWTPAC
jgi:imidazole glycerol-phosphate synthase subunit HisH